jgi:hypothetical protein
MKTNVTESSLDAYFDIKQTSTSQDQQRKIISVMQPETIYTRRQLAMLSGIETSTVSARVNSMIDTVIEIIGKVKDPYTNKTVEALKLKAAA